MREAAIVSTARTPIGKAFRGAFNQTHGATMGGHVIEHAVRRAGVDPAEVEDVVMGCGLPEGATGKNIARLSAVRAGLPVSTSAMTVNRFCSSGLQAIAAALAGVARIEAGEIDPFAGAAIRLNAALNGAALEVVLDDLVGRDDGRWDVVLAGDVFYERPMAERVEPWLRRLAARGTLVLLGDPGRSYLPRNGLERLIAYSVKTSRDLEDTDVRNTVVWRLQA